MTDMIVYTSFTLSMALLSISLAPASVSGAEVLQNPGFESSGSWYGLGCTFLYTNTAPLAGQQNGFVTARSEPWHGVRQNVALTGNKRYTFSIHIKLANLAPGFLYHSASLKYTCTDAQGKRYYGTFATDPFLSESKWTKLAGTQTIPTVANDCKVYVAIPEPEVNYYLDEASLQLVPDDTSWKNEAEARIEQFRKADVSLTLIDNGANTANITIELEQTSHEFGFGTAVAADQITNTSLTAFRDFVFDNFEWAVIGNALKWGATEKVQGDVNFTRAAKAIEVLRAHGMKVRGHNVAWGVEKHIQTWVKNLTPAGLVAAIENRINDVIRNTTCQLRHFDVNNENLHGDFFERGTGDPDITLKMFRDIHAIDPDVELFLNDYNVITNGDSATALMQQGLRFKTEGVPIHGLGIQGHFSSSDIDMTAVKVRLDTVAEAGLRIWITELSVAETDPVVTAQVLDDLYTLFYSLPAIDGVLLWGFWDGGVFSMKSVLAEGTGVTPNAAGQAYLNLFHTRWRTNHHQPIAAGQPVSIRAFKGGYNLKVKRNGNVIKSQKFTLGDNGVTMNIHLTT